MKTKYIALIITTFVFFFLIYALGGNHDVRVSNPRNIINYTLPSQFVESYFGAK